MPELTIGEVAHQAKLRTSALRYYESIGLVSASRRVSGQRRYDQSVLQRLTVIQLAQEAGFTVAEIKALFFSFPPETPAFERWQAMAKEKLVQINGLIQKAEAMKMLLEEGLLQCRCLTLEECAQCISERQP
ncbi:MAG TPA: MerR family transcriptional regulator [Ktedonobacterales bacterium]|jgi:MerR family redox-sensitive transcriptional activator SoxR